MTRAAHMLVRPDGAVLSRIGTNPTYWQDGVLADCINYRYVVRFPSPRGARAAATMHGGTPQQVPCA